MEPPVNKGAGSGGGIHGTKSGAGLVSRVNFSAVALSAILMNNGDKLGELLIWSLGMNLMQIVAVREMGTKGIGIADSNLRDKEAWS